MYPADKFGVGFTVDDLPETITLTRYDNNYGDYPECVGGPFEMTKTGGTYPYYSGVDQLGLGLSLNLTDIGDGEFVWELHPYCVSAGPGGSEIFYCLIQQGGFHRAEIEDQFAAELEVDMNGLFGNSGVEIISRTSLCTWGYSHGDAEGYPYALNVYYNEEEAVNFLGTPVTLPACTWCAYTDLSSPIWICIKNGDQNTPAGTYDAYYEDGSGAGVLEVAEVTPP